MYPISFDHLRIDLTRCECPVLLPTLKKIGVVHGYKITISVKDI